MRRLSVVAAFGLLAYIALVSPVWAIPSRPRIDPAVLADTANGQSGDFLVVLRPQANARLAASQTTDRRQRAPRVVGALRQMADATQGPLRAQLAALNAKYESHWIVNILAVHGDRTVLDTLALRSDVAVIEADRPFRANLGTAQAASSSALGIEWGVSKVNAPVLWALGTTGTGIVYATADTGVQWDHPALINHYRGWNGSTVDHNYNWKDGVTEAIVGASPCGYNTQAPCDDDGHGTHVTGTGVGDDGAGNQIGIAPGAKWIACRNMDNGVGRPLTYIRCLEFFIAPTDLAGNNPDPSKHADVIGNSYGCPSTELCAPESLHQALVNVRAAGIFASVAAGNQGSNCGTVDDTPGLDAASISVGAVDSSDVIASFSSRGPVTIDGSNRRKPELVAPGVGVRSSIPTNGYASKQGTSMAAPHLAGGVALLWSAFPSMRGNVDGTLQLLESSAVPLTTLQGCGGDTSTQVPNNVYGYGRMDLQAAYALELTDPVLWKYYFPFVSKSP